jgi:hypothetical protein
VAHEFPFILDSLIANSIVGKLHYDYELNGTSGLEFTVQFLVSLSIQNPMNHGGLYDTLPADRST